jgi:hypothetical protein
MPYILYNSICRCLTQLFAKDITPDEKQELDEALQREVICLDILFITLKDPKENVLI